MSQIHGVILAKQKTLKPTWIVDSSAIAKTQYNMED